MYVKEALMGIFDRLFGKSANGSTKPMTDDEAMKIINAYGKAMMDRKSTYGDVSALPYSKARIKEALIHGIKEGDDPQFRDQLKAAYVALAEWQPGLGNRRLPGELSDDELRDPARAMARIADSTDFLKIPADVAAEANVLQADLKALGLA
jgi:hypothetical protein